MKLFFRIFKNFQETNQMRSQVQLQNRQRTHLANGLRSMPNHRQTTVRNSNSQHQPSAPPISYISRNWNDHRGSMVPNGQLAEDLPPTYEEAITSKDYKEIHFT